MDCAHYNLFREHKLEGNIQSAMAISAPIAYIKVVENKNNIVGP